MTPPLVSVRVITYNHEKYIKTTLDSILAQKTTFPFEIIIGEDCSTDNTRSILLDYSNRYSNIKLILSDINIGANLNERRTRLACTAKYIAWMDGDDYWIDEYKLQKQVEFLEINPDYSVCFSNAYYVEGDQQTARTFNLDKTNMTFNGVDILNKWLISNSSVVYRNHLFEEPSFFYRSTLVDLGVLLMVSEYGKIFYFKDCMSIYRIHPNSLSQVGFKGLVHNKKSIILFKHLDHITNYKYHKQFELLISNYSLSTSLIYLYKYNKLKAKRFFLSALSKDLLIIFRQPADVIKIILGLISNRFLNKLKGIFK